MQTRMPPEWAPHARMWMGWPVHAGTVAAVGGRRAAERAWAAVANAVVAFEPVTLLCPPGETGRARALLDPRITLVEADLGDGWLRDTGPTFVVADDALAAVDWTFNGWGGRSFPEAAADALVARLVAERAGARRIPSTLVAEGGGLHVDGEGTLLLTESVQLNPNRNPNRSRAEVEAEMCARLGAEKVIWLPRGLVADTGPYGTDGHVDTLAAFVRPGTVVVHAQPDPGHPDNATAAEIASILASETDARGRPLEVVPLTAPAERMDADGAPLSCSYVNFAFVNGGIVMPAFDDPADAAAARTLASLCPDRRVVTVDGLPLFRGGGGVHCITQHEPALAPTGRG